MQMHTPQRVYQILKSETHSDNCERNLCEFALIQFKSLRHCRKTVLVLDSTQLRQRSKHSKVHGFMLRA